MQLWVGSDHAAVALRAEVVAHLTARGHHVEQRGPAEGERVDYPDVAAEIARAVADGRAGAGVLLCGTGIGVAIAANKIHGIRAATVHDVTTARLAAAHNRANVICLGARVVGSVVALDCIDAWLDTAFEPRHLPRLERIAALEAGAAGER